MNFCKNLNWLPAQAPQKYGQSRKPSPFLKFVLDALRFLGVSDFEFYSILTTGFWCRLFSASFGFLREAMPSNPFYSIAQQKLPQLAPASVLLS